MITVWKGDLLFLFFNPWQRLYCCVVLPLSIMELVVCYSLLSCQFIKLQVNSHSIPLSHWHRETSCKHIFHSQFLTCCPNLNLSVSVCFELYLPSHKPFWVTRTLPWSTWYQGNKLQIKYITLWKSLNTDHWNHSKYQLP